MTDETTPRTGGAAGEDPPSRRDLLSKASTIAMLGGLGAGYGALAAMAGRYLYPARPRELRWLQVAPVAELEVGGALAFKTPLGERVTITRQGPGETADDFLALSSTCPHLGCQVHWQPAKTRFFCPCHNGVFTPEGRPVEGPPAEAGTPLPRFPLAVRGGVLYLEAPVEGLASAGEVVDPGDQVGGPGHDPCLHPDARPRTA